MYRYMLSTVYIAILFDITSYECVSGINFLLKMYQILNCVNFIRILSTAITI